MPTYIDYFRPLAFDMRRLFAGKENRNSITDVALEPVFDDKIVELGKPRLGEAGKIEVQIRESIEFKSTVDKLLKKTNVALVVGTSSWREQFIEAITVSSGDDENGEDEEDEEKLPSCMDYVMHFLTIFWKVTFAFVPPTDLAGGWLAFSVSICMIGVITALIGDIAAAFGCTIGLKDSVTAVTFVALGTSLPDYWGGWLCFTFSIIMIGILTALINDLASSFGCTIGLKDSVTAISFVALGTSLPDTFASKVAAINDAYADSSIGNVTGSNAVNVFLGIGIAWTIASVKHAIEGKPFKVDPGSLAFSVTVFCCFALAAMAILIIRRRPSIGGELGGKNRNFKICTTAFFIGLWVVYVILSSLESYCHIKGF
ncbi:DgyrCDS11575 [Dimorphilus gyrociliatus]|uniref:DgyrCDS11575 n=1 Tax=Dimorphilus gyrociliatus TaxID=2664684 RepID=A0A7I8W3T9_9ANNE|nr:DgyrCDS11575 [Dimorphilus gyrociliatus]